MYHFIAFLLGFLLDLLVGDPHQIPHPICAIGNLISFLQKKLLKEQDSNQKKLQKGVQLVVGVLFSTFLVVILLLWGAYWIHPLLGFFMETIMTWQILAIKSLKTESAKVYTALQEKGLVEARKAVSMIVGRDTQNLDEAGVIRAAVETVAENTSDGVIAPMLYLAIGGPVLGFLYKAINTMDSMVGYKNDKYLYFGRAAAKLDDVVNFIPARISAELMIWACVFGKEFDGRRARAIHRRDHGNHSSPNSAQTESVCAGALGIRLAGPSYYFGKLVEKPYIGDAIREIEREDILRVHRLLLGTAVLGEGICLTVIGGILWILTLL